MCALWVPNFDLLALATTPISLPSTTLASLIAYWATISHQSRKLLGEKQTRQTHRFTSLLSRAGPSLTRPHTLLPIPATLAVRTALTTTTHAAYATSISHEPYSPTPQRRE